MRPWTISYGLREPRWGIGALVGVVAVNLGFREVGRTLVIFVSIATIVRAFVILFSDLRYWRNVIVLVVLLPVLVLVRAGALKGPLDWTDAFAAC